MLKLLALISITLAAMAISAQAVPAQPADRGMARRLDMTNHHSFATVFNKDKFKRLRAKKRAGKGVTTPPGTEDCVDHCIETSVQLPEDLLPWMMEVIQDVYRDQDSTNIKKFFNETMINQYCGVMRATSECINKCPPDADAEELKKFFTTTKYMCTETKFAENAKCYRDVYDADTNQCETEPKCGQYKYSSMKAKTPEAERQNLESYAVKVANNMCQYITCGLDCRKPELVSKCGQEKFDVLKMFYQKLVHSAEKVLQTVAEVVSDDEEHQGPKINPANLKFGEKCNTIGQVAA